MCARQRKRGCKREKAKEGREVRNRVRERKGEIEELRRIIFKFQKKQNCETRGLY